MIFKLILILIFFARVEVVTDLDNTDTAYQKNIGTRIQYLLDLSWLPSAHINYFHFIRTVGIYSCALGTNTGTEYVESCQANAKSYL
jgi:hypothetical protein